MKGKWLIPALLVIILFFSIPRLVLLPRVEQEFEAELQSRLQTEQAQVDIIAPLGWELVMGRIPRLEISISDATIKGLDIERAEFQGEDLLFVPATLWRERELVLTDASNLTGEMVISQGALNKLFWEEVDPERHLSMVVTREGLGLQGTVAVWNLEWTITLLGELEVVDGSALRFVVKNLEVEETRLPAIVLDVLSDNYSFVMDLGVFPYPVEITAVETLEEEILVKIGGLP